MFTGLDFTTLARMRNILGFAENDLERDAELSRLIRTVSADMEDDMRRFVRQTAYVEILTLWPPSRILSLSGVPVASTGTCASYSRSTNATKRRASVWWVRTLTSSSTSTSKLSTSLT